MRNWPAGRLSGVQKIRRTFLILMSVTVGLIGSAVLASPVNALPELYKHGFYSGTGNEKFWSPLDNVNYEGDYFEDGTPTNDKVSSIKNMVSGDTCFYIHSGYSGYAFTMGQNQQFPGLADYNDRLSSHDFNCDE